MKKSSNKVFPLFLAICMVFCACNIPASARSSDYIDAYSASCTARSGRKIIVTVDVDALSNMTNVGASTIIIYHSSDGVNYSQAMSYNYEDYPNMMGSGYYYYASPVIYYGTVGHYYTARVYCYAGNTTGGDTRIYDTAAVRCVA